MSYEPEVGQAVFGAKYSEYGCPDYIESLLRTLGDEIERVEWNITQKHYDAPTKNVGGEYKTDIFEMRSYYWGDCTCGFEKVADFEGKHNLDCYQTEYDLLYKKYGSCLNIPDKSIIELCTRHNLPYNEGWGSAVHCTCDYWKRLQDFLIEIGYPNGHKDDCLLCLPNFQCGDFEVRWYKYLGRGMSMNRQIDSKEMIDIFNKCIASVRRKER